MENMQSAVLYCSGPHDVLLQRILSFLPSNELILTIRLVNHSWKRAVTYTSVSCLPNNMDSVRLPQTVLVDQVKLRSLIRILPRLQTIDGHHDGGLPEESVRLIVNGFKEVTRLDISSSAIFEAQQDPSLATVYAPDVMPSICSTWKDRLVQLDVSRNPNVEMDLKLLSTVRNLEVFSSSGCGNRIQGQLSSLATLPDLQICDLHGCPMVQGHVHDLAGNSNKKLLYLALFGTSVQGRLLDLQLGDFESLVYIDWIHGGSAMEQQEAQESIGVDIEGNICGIYLGKNLASISSAPMAVKRVFDLAQILPSLRLNLCSVDLSIMSPDYYRKPNQSSKGLYRRDPPFHVELLSIQGRRGWRWTNGTKKGACEIQWRDPLPDFETKKEYAEYQSKLQLLTSTDSIYGGWSQPPTEEEHNDLMYKKLIQQRRRARRQQRDEGE
ncbi:MAG: hypothetical protein SGBAC_006419 [Bacillariaceae sp.]